MAFVPHDWKDGETVITAGMMKAIEQELVDIRRELPLTIWPVGSIWMSVENIDPTTIIGGEWIAWGSGRVPVGVDQNQEEFNEVEKTGGEKSAPLHTHTTPNHKHTISVANGGSHTHKVKAAKTTKTGGTATRATATEAGGTHKHTLSQESSGGGKTGGSGGTGSGNLQPYITCYMFKRVK